jgi:hypothetical protein
MMTHAAGKCKSHTDSRSAHCVLSIVSSYAGHGHSRRHHHLIVVVVVSSLHYCCCCCALNQERGGGGGDDTYVMCNLMSILCRLGRMNISVLTNI